MPLFARRSRPVLTLPLVLPRPDGTGWPDLARPSFEASTYHELGTRRAYEPEAHAVAARIGAGIGLVDREQVAPGSHDLDPAIAGALLLARRGLPAMQADWARVGGWFLLAGHRLGRCGPDALPELLEVL